MKLIVLTLICVVTALSFAQAQILTDSQQNDLLRFDPQVRYGRLDNGLTYYIKQTDRSLDKVYMEVVVKAGKVHEESKQLGAAHLLEHMGFRSLKHFPQGIKKYLRKNGVIDNGVDINANTGWNATKYHIYIPNNKNMLDSSMYILRDWTDGFSLIPGEVVSEIGVVTAETRGALETNRAVSMQDSRLLQNVKYPPNSVDLLLENYKSFKIEELNKFYHTWYRADRQAVIIIGDIDVDEMEQKIIQVFTSLPKSTRIVSDTKVIAEAKVKRNKPFTSIKEWSREDVSICMHRISPSIGHGRQDQTVKEYRQNVIDKLFKQMLDFRLGALRPLPSPQMSSAILERSAINPLAAVDLFTFSFSAPDGDSLEFRFKRAYTELESIRRFGFEDAEFVRAKDAVKIKAESDRNIGVSELATIYSNHFIYKSAAPMTSNKTLLNEFLLGDISIQELNDAALKWIDALRESTIMVNAPSRVIKGMSSSTVSDWISEIKNAPNIKVNKVSLKSLPPLPRRNRKLFVVDTLTNDQERRAGVTQLKINGLEVLIRPMKSNGQAKIRMQCFREGGAKLYGGDNYVNALNAAQIANFSGVAGLSEADLSQIFWGSDTRVQPYIFDDEEGIYASCQPAQVEAMLHLIYLYFTLPNRNETAFNKWRARNKSSIKDIDKINLDSAFKIFTQRFSAANGFKFVFTGDLSDSSCERIVEYLCLLPINLTQTTEFSKDINANKSGKTVATRASGSVTVRIGYFGHSNYSELVNLSLKMLQEYLRIKLYNRIRQKEGATYSVSVAAQAEPSGNYSIFISYETDPSLEAETVRIVKQEINDLKVLEPDGNILEQTISQLLANNEADIKQNLVWHKYLVDQYRNNGKVDAILDREQLIKQFTSWDLQETAKYFLVE